MTQNLKKLFQNLKNVEPSQGFEVKILKAIALEKSFEIRKKMLFARAGLAVSFSAFFYALLVFGKTFLASDFWSLAKLIFTDTGIVAGRIGEFSYSLLETLPVIEIFAMLVPAFILAMMFSWYFKFSNNKFNHIT